MYLYSLLFLVIGLVAGEHLGLPWTRLTAAAPLDLLQRVPGGSQLAALLVLATLYGLAWTLATMGVHIWGFLYTPNDGSRRYQTTEAVAAAGFSREGLAPCLWAVVALVPPAVVVWLVLRGFTVQGMEVLFLGGALIVAATQALRPFRWREDLLLGAAALVRQLGRVSRPPVPLLREAAALQEPPAETVGPARPEPDLWGDGWLQVGVPGPQTRPPQLDPDKLSLEMDGLAQRYGDSFPLDRGQRNALIRHAQVMLEKGYANAVAWGFVSTMARSNDRQVMLALWQYRVVDAVPRILRSEPVAAAPIWKEGTADFRFWVRPSPAYTNLPTEERSRFLKGEICKDHQEVTNAFELARPLQPVAWWHFTGFDYIVKEMYDVSAV